MAILFTFCLARISLTEVTQLTNKKKKKKKIDGKQLCLNMKSFMYLYIFFIHKQYVLLIALIALGRLSFSGSTGTLQYSIVWVTATLWCFIYNISLSKDFSFVFFKNKISVLRAFSHPVLDWGQGS